jgi:hypothetical protein
MKFTELLKRYISKFGWEDTILFGTPEAQLITINNWFLGRQIPSLEVEGILTKQMKWALKLE